MAKKKAQAPAAGALHPGMQALLEHAMHNCGGNVCLASDLADRVWGLPSDHISYRYLVDQTVYPMGKIIGVAGQKESCKSAFAMAIARVWMEAGGFCVYVDTENKKSPPLYKAIVGTDNLLRTMDFRAENTEEWQEQILSSIAYVAENENFAGVPVLFIVDSLGGVDPNETSERIDKEGSSNARNTGGMVKSKSHNEFFRNINRHLVDKPYGLIYINHLSDDIGSPIPGAKRKPGGTGQDYHAVQDFWLSAVKAKPVYKATRNFSERLLKIQLKKNSHGISQRDILIPYRMRTHPETGQLDEVWFDWDAATAMLLTEEKGEVRQRLAGVLNVTVNAGKYSCQQLGLVKVTDSEIGAALRNDVELRERVSDLLGINRTKLFANVQVADRAVYEQPVSIRTGVATPAPMLGAADEDAGEA